MPTAFVLLKEDNFDQQGFFRNLKQLWNLDVDTQAEFPLFAVEGSQCVIMNIDAPIPGEEAENRAALNYYWKNARETVSQHRAHLIVSTEDSQKTPLDVMKLHSKVLSACAADPNVLGIYTSGTVFAPEFYRQMASGLKKGELPIPIWVFIGLYADATGNSAYTIGMENLGKTEMEILGSQYNMPSLHAMMMSIADYTIRANIDLHDGETLGFDEYQKLSITLSPSSMDPEVNSLKIGY